MDVATTTTTTTTTTPSSVWPATIEEWVNGLGLGEESASAYIKLFKEQEVTVGVLPSFSAQDLIDVGVTKIGARKSMLKSIEEFKAAETKSKLPPEVKGEVKEEKPVPPPIVSISSFDRDPDFKCTPTLEGIYCFPVSRKSYKPIWTGGRATRGVYKGKHWFEFTITELIPEAKISEDVALGKYGCRVGWSTLDTPVHLLGDTPDSFAFDMSGARVTNKEAVSYGDSWSVNDALGCFLDLDLYTISYSRNGVWLQIANVIPEDFHGKFFFPHVVLKNVKCKVNFGERASVTPVPQGYEWLTEASPVNSSEGPKAPASKSECEAILLVGLAFSGKTTWARKFVKEHPDKRYTILGPDQVMEHLKPWLFPSQIDEKDEHVKEEKVKALRHKAFLFCVHAINGLLRKLEDSPRNVIIDSGRTNTFLAMLRRVKSPHTQLEKRYYQNGRRDWRGWNFFAGFGKKSAYVFLTPIADLKKRAEDEKKQNPNAPEGRLLVRPGRLVKVLPLSAEHGFDEIHYVDLDTEEAIKALESYKEESKTEPVLSEESRSKRKRGFGRGRGAGRGRRRDRRRGKSTKDDDDKDKSKSVKQEQDSPKKPRNENKRDARTPPSKKKLKTEDGFGTGAPRKDTGPRERGSRSGRWRGRGSGRRGSGRRESSGSSYFSGANTYGTPTRYGANAAYYASPIPPQPIIIQAPDDRYYDSYRRGEDSKSRYSGDRYESRYSRLDDGGSKRKYGSVEYLPPPSAYSTPVVYASPSSYYPRY